MNDLAQAEMVRRSNEEGQEMKTGSGRGVAEPAKSEVGGGETEAAPRPWSLSSVQQASGEAEVSACPWRVQPRRKQWNKVEAQETALDTVGVMKEADS